MTSAAPSDPAGPTSRRRALGWSLALAAVAVAVVLLVVQARLISAAFRTPLEAGSAQLPSSLEPLAAGPGPVAVAAPAVVVPSRAADVVVVAASNVDLSAWSAAVGAQVGVPAVALAAYGAAQLEVAASDPDCHLSWPTLAGIGYIESQHGSYGGAVLGADGRSTPPIVGIALDGRTGVALISDSDDGALDGDPTLDRAVGPMQFIPSTWAVWGADGDADGSLDPFDIDDAALSAAHYLCAAGGDLATGSGWTRSIYAYNASDRYVLDVRAAADEYATRSTAN